MIPIEITDALGTTTSTSGNTALANAVISAFWLVASSPTFQTMVNEPDAENAALHIYPHTFENFIDGIQDIQDARPCAIVGVVETNYEKINQKAGRSHHNYGGSVYVAIQAPPPINELNKAMSLFAYTRFLNQFGGIIEDMSGEFYGPNDLIGFDNINVLVEPDRTPADLRAQEDDYFDGVMEFSTQARGA